MSNLISLPTNEGVQSIDVEKPDEEKSEAEIKEQIQGEPIKEETEIVPQKEESEEEFTPKDYIWGLWMNPLNVEYRRERCHAVLLTEIK